MLGMKQPWRNTGCRLATCRCCCWMRGPKCWGCNSLGATQAAGWQPAGVAAGCEAQNAGWQPAGGCRLVTCRCCCWMRGPKCWGCNNLGATQAAGWQPAGVAAGCEAQNAGWQPAGVAAGCEAQIAGDATALAQHRLQVGNLQVLLLDARPKMLGMQQPWRNTGCRLATCRCCCWMRGPKCWGCNSLGATQAGNLQVLLLDARPKMLGMQQPWRNTGCRLATCRCCCWMRGPKCRLATCRCCCWMRGPNCWGCNSLGATQAAGWQPAGVAAGCKAQNAGDATALAQHRLQVGNLQVLLLDARPKMLGMQQPWRNTGCRLATCRCCCWMRGPKCWGCMLDARPKMLGMQQPWRNTGCRLATCRCCCWMRGPKCWGCSSLGATQAAGWQPAGVAAGCEAQNAGDATGNLQVLLLDARPKMLGMQQPWRNTGCRLATCRCCCWMRGPKCWGCNSLGATQAAGWQPAGVAAGCEAQHAGDACWMQGPKCWGCNSLGATQAAGWQPAGVAAGCEAQNDGDATALAQHRLQVGNLAGVAAGCEAQHAGDATTLAQHRLQVGNLQVLLLDARPKVLGMQQPWRNTGCRLATCRCCCWMRGPKCWGCNSLGATQAGNLHMLLLDARPKMLGMQQPWRNTGCRLATCRCCCWMRGPKCWGCNSPGATQAAGWQPAGVAAGCEAQNAGDATALAQVGNLQVLLLDARPKMLGMQQPWRNTGCRATCRCCCWMRGPKCWGCNSLGATQAAGWQPAGVAAGCEAQNAGDATALAQHRLQVGNLQVLLLDARPKMLGMQQPCATQAAGVAAGFEAQNAGDACWMRGPKCWGCNSLGATQAAGWQPAGVAAGCEAQNAGDATALAQHRLQVGNLQVLLLYARRKMLGMQQPWRNTGCRLATCRCCCWMRGPKCWGCNSLGATQAAGQPAGVTAGCEAQNAGDATALAQHRLQVGNLQVLLLDARPKMPGMQQPWRNTGCRLATCRCCCWMRGPKCWGCNSLGATQAAGWQPAGVAAGCEAQNAGDATALAQHRLQVGNLQVLLLDARPKMLGMQQPWRNTGCRLATCRCCCWMRGPKCWGCNNLGATQAAGWQPAGVAAGCKAQNAGDATAQAAGWQPAGVAAGCEAQNAGDATALAQHRLQPAGVAAGCEAQNAGDACWMRGPTCWGCNSLGATQAAGWQPAGVAAGCEAQNAGDATALAQHRLQLATCRCCCWMRGPKCWGCNNLGATQAAGWQPAGVAAGCEAQNAGDATALAQHRLQVGNLQVLLLDARPKMLGMQQPWRNTGCRLATCRCCCWMRGPKCWGCNSLGATQAAGWQPAGVAAGCEAQNAGDATALAQHRLQVGNLQVLLLDARPKMLGMQQPWRNTGCRLATCRCCCWMRGPKCWGCNSLGATQAAGWQPAGFAAGCEAQNAGDATALAQHRLQVRNLQVLLLDARPKMLGMQQPWRNTGCRLATCRCCCWMRGTKCRLATCRCCCWMRGPKCWGCNSLGATQAAGWQPAGVAAGCEAQNAGDATALAQHRLQVGNLQVLLLDARPKMLGMQQPWRNTGCRLATCRCCCWMRGPKCWGCNSLGATQAAGWQPAGVAAGCEAQNAGDACWMRGPKCWGCNSLGATQAAGSQPAGVAAGCEAQNAGDATALAQHRLQVGNLQVLLLDARPKMLGMQQPWRNTGCRLATCRCCCWMRGPKCWGCNSLGATQAAGWQPAGVAAGCEAQNAGDATTLAQHRLQVGNLQVLLLDARPKMLGMQQPWRNTGCRLATCRCCCWMRGPKCWGCNSLGATQAAGQPAGVTAGCEAQNAGDATALAQHRLQVGNLQVSLLDARPKMPGMQEPWRNTGCRLATCRCCCWMRGPKCWGCNSLGATQAAGVAGCEAKNAGDATALAQHRLQVGNLQVLLLDARPKMLGMQQPWRNTGCRLATCRCCCWMRGPKCWGCNSWRNTGCCNLQMLLLDARPWMPGPKMLGHVGSQKPPRLPLVVLGS